MSDCYVPGQLTDKYLCLLATQYRDSQKLKDYIAVLLREIEELQCLFCEMFDLTLDNLGDLVGFPRCWCNIKKKKVLTYTKPPTFYFGFDYVEGETVVTPQSCLRGLDEGVWIQPGQNPDCALEDLNGCCTINDPTAGGYCESEWDCGKFPLYEDHCFDDDAEYARLLNAKIVADQGIGQIAQIEKVIKILYGDQAQVLDAFNAEVLIGINRGLTDNEKLLIDFYKNLIPTALGVKTTIVENVYTQFGFDDETGCYADRVAGYCDGVFEKRY